MTPEEWEKVRVQAAIAAMPLIERMLDGYSLRVSETLAYHCVKLADALIEELKKGK